MLTVLDSTALTIMNICVKSNSLHVVDSEKEGNQN